MATNLHRQRGTGKLHVEWRLSRRGPLVAAPFVESLQKILYRLVFGPEIAM
ncbi:MAG TPA: hypothetical protein VIH17_03185 [Candidatus Acidoferrales bacterium]